MAAIVRPDVFVPQTYYRTLTGLKNFPLPHLEIAPLVSITSGDFNEILDDVIFYSSYSSRFGIIVATK
ncbi:hypothetical protein Y032_0109g100 [Ancylostoma ceylanicum]|uniref:Uncharacterized protein n=1 Tax=Ancylostoma ceylanicum TaxID=53326 RepID=A0A016TE00_9BILA|nr:hypothetical protein Y032_0109g100 [Ancylostoma ceylanicum]